MERRRRGRPTVCLCWGRWRWHRRRRRRRWRRRRQTRAAGLRVHERCDAHEDEHELRSEGHGSMESGHDHDAVGRGISLAPCVSGLAAAGGAKVLMLCPPSNRDNTNTTPSPSHTNRPDHTRKHPRSPRTRGHPRANTRPPTHQTHTCGSRPILEYGVGPPTHTPPAHNRVPTPPNTQTTHVATRHYDTRAQYTGCTYRLPHGTHIHRVALPHTCMCLSVDICRSRRSVRRSVRRRQVVVVRSSADRGIGRRTRGCS